MRSIKPNNDPYDPISELRKYINQHYQHIRIVSLRKQCTKIEPEESLYHEIKILESEKKLVQLLEPNLAFVLIDEDPEIRSVISEFKNGAISGKVISGELTWQDLYDYIDMKLLTLNKKYKLIQDKLAELKELYD